MLLLAVVALNRDAATGIFGMGAETRRFQGAEPTPDLVRCN